MIRKSLSSLLLTSLLLTSLVGYSQDFGKFSFGKAEDGSDSKTGNVEVSWSNEAVSGLATHIKYRVKGSANWTTSKLSSANISSEELDGLSPDMLYEYALGSAKLDSDSVAWGPPFGFNTLTSSAFTILFAKDKEEEATTINWALNYNVANGIDNIIVKYNTKIGAKIGEPWSYTEPISATKNKVSIDGLDGDTKYVFKVGVPRQGDIEQALSSDDFVWSAKGKFTTGRGWGIFKFLVLIGALGIFIYGMKVMSEGLQLAAGSGMRKILSSMTSNRFKGVLSGFLITGLVQSSSATTVMTVSFVNAGLLTLVESAGIMMGANIGTTITGWLVSIFGFKVSISAYALVIVALGVPLMFMRSSKLKAWGNALIGFAILFMGLSLLKKAVPSLGADSVIVQFFLEYSSIPVLGTLMFVALGALVTIVIQSSSAAMALTMTLMVNGVIPFPVAAAMILGENIGTTITAELASMIGNVHAKRSARIHSMFNIVGVTWMVLVIPYVLKAIGAFMDVDPFGTGEENRESATAALALFHTVFNLANVLLLIWFVPLLVKLAIRTVKSKGDADEERHLEYIDAGLMATPELSVMEAKKEIARLGELTARMSTFMQELMQSKDAKKSTSLLKKIRNYEEITDRVEVEISDYLLKISQGELSSRVSGRVRSILSISNDLERIGDIFFQMSKTVERKQEEKLWFTPDQRDKLGEMFELVDKALTQMVSNLNGAFDAVSIKRAKDIEFDLNGKRNELRKAHLKSIEKGDYNIKSGMIYSDLVSSCEKVGDHAINVTEAIVGEV